MARECYVLLAELQTKDIKLIDSILKRDKTTKYIIDIVNSTKEIENKFVNGMYDVLLFGHSLSNADHIQFIRSFQDIYHTPIIVLFNAGEETFVKENLLSNYADCIAKHSISQLVLSRSIEFAIEKSVLLRKLAKAEKKVRVLSTRDPLTLLPNRNTFFELISKEIDNSERNNLQFAVLNIGINNIKGINNSLGHKQAEGFLVAIAKRLRQKVRKVDTIARFADDEFGLLLPAIQDSQIMSKLAQHFLKIFSEPFVVDGTEFFISANLGISIYPNDGAETDGLLRCAESAMHDARHKGINSFNFYSEILNEQTSSRLEMENDLRKAIDQKEFTIHYQPLIDANRNTVVAAEALVRWNHPKKGLLTPNDFIATTEKTGLIEIIGNWVLFEACRQNKAWQNAGLPKIRVAVNISAKQFSQEDLVDNIQAILNETQLHPIWLELELTENVFLQNIEHSLDTLTKIKNLGIRVSIDDFGTGYSSLSYLRQLPIDTLKIDQSFIHHVNTGDRDTAIVKAIISLAKNLTIETVAEGIESNEQHADLVEMGCDYLQGFLFQKPVEPEHFSFLLNKNPAQSSPNATCEVISA